MGARPERVVRADSRLGSVLDAAARLFAGKGYAATSMREIAQAAEMLPGSLYCHFASKDELLVAVYAAGVEEIIQAVQAAVARERAPWARLEAACAAHLETVLRRSDYAQVLIRVVPEDAPAVAAALTELRRRYEASIRSVIDALPIEAAADRRAVRLFLLGALNWTRFWFRDPETRPDPASGTAARDLESPGALARRLVQLVRYGIHPPKVSAHGA